MTETPQQDRVNTDNLRDYSQLRRSVADRKVAGVAGGLGQHLNIDPTILRVAFVVLAFFGGAGFLLYGALWLFVPEDGSETAAITTSPSTRTTLIVVAGVLAALLLVGDGWGQIWFPWPLALIGLVIALVLMNRDKPVSTTYPPPPPGTPQPGTGTEQTATLPTAAYAAPTGYAEPFGAAAPPAPPAAAYPVYQPPAPRPDRGPKLFWFTLALLAVALGTLGLADVNGSVPDPAYPALALAVVGAMLVVGAWFGRPGGLILLGLVAAVGLFGASVGEANFENDAVRSTPASAAELDDRYTFTAGSTHLDLTELGDLDALDGRTITVEGNAGDIVVTLPEDVDVDIDAGIAAAGELDVLGQQRSGLGRITIERSIDGGVDVPAFDLNLDLVVGNIEVRQ